jgi:hypothetical protein
MKDTSLRPEYSASRALIIGINTFRRASPLVHAVSNAEAVRDALTKNFEFPRANMTFLSDHEATRAAIMSAYLSFAGNGTEINDRLFVFYAGHGLTLPGKGGEVGYLVPHDGNADDVSTLIRWDELTFNAGRINAKHILFVLEACYGGLPRYRTVAAGSMRFLKDMFLRPVRQILTAGTADQTVAHTGGPRPNHTVFTGHLLDALDGHAVTEDGVITANGVMAYVYDKVSADIHSRQTPHFGFFDGDGDFIFRAPVLTTLMLDEKVDHDILITIPSTHIPENVKEGEGLVDVVKAYLAEPKYGIRLFDLAIHHVRRLLVETTLEKLPAQGSQFSGKEIKDRLERYEKLMHDLKQMVSCIAYWGDESQSMVMQKAVGRATDHLQPQSGLEAWDAARWYPIMLLFYAGGIAALAAKKYDNLFKLFTTAIASRKSMEDRTDLILSLRQAILELERDNVFKRIPGHEQYYVPRSEYLFKRLQPDLDELLFLGKEYEPMFDRLEVMLALVCADLRSQKEQVPWGPIGRFGWKYRDRMGSKNPLKAFIEEANEQDKSWPPLKAGFFGGDVQRFKAVASAYEERIKGLRWG